VPVKNATVTPEIKNGSLSDCVTSSHTFQCTTSAARPAPNVIWVFQDELSEIETIRVRGNETIAVDGHLLITKSELHFVANKSLNKRLFFCSSRNIPDEEVKSRVITLNIRCKFNFMLHIIYAY
jgi:hypothetical protein